MTINWDDQDYEPRDPEYSCLTDQLEDMQEVLEIDFDN